MQSILYFDVCSIPIFLVILITVFVRKMTHGISNKLFISLLAFSAAAAITDVALEYACRQLPVSDTRLLIAEVFTHLYFITRNATIVCYFFFVFAITGTWYRVRRKRMKAIVLTPFAVELIIILTNPVTHAVFRIDPESGYERGAGIMALYGISFMYALVGTVYLLSCRRFLTKGKVFSLISLYVLSLSAVIVQFFFPYLLIEMMVTAFSMILIILFVLRPEENSDATVGSLSFEAYKNALKKILMTGQKVQIAVINFLNANELRSYLGEERYLNYAAHVIHELDILFRHEKTWFDIYFEHPGTIYIIVDDLQFNIRDAYFRLAGELRRNSDKAAESGERINAAACSIVIPDDLNDRTQIIRFGHEFMNVMKHGTGFAEASEIMSSRDYGIISNMDTILSRAIEQKRFRMYYQPIYSVERGRFISAEALIRLIDDEFGFVPPSMFIPAAEKRGVILPIGDFVLEDVHRFISENDFDELGLEYIEINLSVAQCMQEELPEKLAFLSDKYGVSPDRINLEITETTYEEMGGVMQFNLDALSGIGYTFSLDDYGTGYSNMQRVSKLPLKMIKLDKSLVDDMVSHDGLSIVRNTVKMMRDIDKELVAEGVETKENLEYLREMGCHFIQGYYFSKPLPADDFVAFIRKHNCKQGA